MAPKEATTGKQRAAKGILVIGGGVAGIQAALDLAKAGAHVYLVEKTPSAGGRMASTVTFTVPVAVTRGSRRVL